MGCRQIKDKPVWGVFGTPSDAPNDCGTNQLEREDTVRLWCSSMSSTGANKKPLRAPEGTVLSTDSSTKRIF